MANKTDIVIKRGNTYEQQIEATDEGGAPYDLTGWKVQFMVKRDIADADANALVNISLTGIANPTLGTAVFTIPAAQTAAFPVGTFIYAYQVIMPNGAVYETESGQCTINADVIQGVV